MDWKWLTTTALLAYIAALLTYREYITNRVNIKLELSFSPASSPLNIFLHIKNPGRVTVVFTTGLTGLFVDGHKSFPTVMKPAPDGNVVQPYVLKPGMSLLLFNNVDSLKSNLKELDLKQPIRIRARNQDALERQYYSNWVTVTLDDHELLTK